MFVWMVADRALDIIGLGSIVYWTIKATAWWHRRHRNKGSA
jgi:hypothetical protein